MDPIGRTETVSVKGPDWEEDDEDDEKEVEEEDAEDMGGVWDGAGFVLDEWGCLTALDVSDMGSVGRVIGEEGCCVVEVVSKVVDGETAGAEDEDDDGPADGGKEDNRLVCGDEGVDASLWNIVAL